MRCLLLFGVLAVALAAPAQPDLPPVDTAKDAEPLPDPPRADPKSVLKPLLPDNSLYLEDVPGGGRRVLVTAEVCLREGQLEVFLCRTGTKEHEAIVRTAVDARYLHAGLEAAGAKPGTPVRFLHPQTGEPDYKPATGDKIDVLVSYRRAGAVHTHAAREWITDLKTKKPMAHDWVFAGSRLFKNPEKPEAPPYYCANNGSVIGISNFSDSMLDLPVEVGQDNSNLGFEARTEKIPPVMSKVWVVLAPGKK